MDSMARFYLTLSALVSDRVASFRRDDRGQGTIEYVGMVIVAAIIVLALLQTDMGDTIAEEFTGRIEDILDSE